MDSYDNLCLGGATMFAPMGWNGAKKSNFSVFKLYIFVKIAIYETNLMHNELNVTQVHTIVINCPNPSV